MQLSPVGLKWLKSALHLAFLMPLLWLIYGINQNALGGDPVQYLIHFTGKGALHGLMATLLVTPLSRSLHQANLMQCRRLLGLWAFTYSLLHVLAFVSLDLLFAWSMLFAEVLKRNYLLLGMLGMLIMTALAITSFKRLQRRMGRNWQRLHNLVYVLAILVPIHFLWSVKSEIIEPSLYLALCLLLLWLRRDKIKRIFSVRIHSSQPSHSATSADTGGQQH